MDSKMDEVCIPPPPPAAEVDVDSNVITLPTLEATLSSPPDVVGNPDKPVMDEAALGTVESMSLLLTMGTMVAGGVLPSAPKELSNEDIGSTSTFAAADAELSFDEVLAGGGGDTVVGTTTPVAGWALMDGTIIGAAALLFDWDS